MQLVQREKMASVGQLVAGVAHELNNPIGFVYSNVATLEDFTRRLRAMLEVYRQAPLPEADQARVQAEWDRLKVDYALRYLDAMTQGIREGAERARKIGATSLRSVGDIARHQRLHDNDEEFVEPREMLAELAADNQELTRLLRAAHAVCDEHEDVATTSLIETWIDEAERRTWFLFEAAGTP